MLLEGGPLGLNQFLEQDAKEQGGPLLLTGFLTHTTPPLATAGSLSTRLRLPHAGCTFECCWLQL